MKTRIVRVRTMAACLALLGYFGWHAFYGPRGFAHHEIAWLAITELTRANLGYGKPSDLVITTAK